MRRLLIGLVVLACFAIGPRAMAQAVKVENPCSGSGQPNPFLITRDQTTGEQRQNGCIARDGSVDTLTPLTLPLPVTSGGTDATTASGARSNLGAAASGANADITALTGLTTPLSQAQGGTGATSLSAAGVLSSQFAVNLTDQTTTQTGTPILSTTGMWLVLVHVHLYCVNSTSTLSAHINWTDETGTNTYTLSGIPNCTVLTPADKVYNIAFPLYSTGGSVTYTATPSFGASDYYDFRVRFVELP